MHVQHDSCCFYLVPKVILLGYIVYHNSVSFQWKVYIFIIITFKYNCYLFKQLMHQPYACLPLIQYQITHNVSSDQSPITVNRTNVTLYGVQPGEIYIVEITPYLLTEKGKPTNFFFSYAVSFLAIATTTTTTTTSTTTTTTTTTTMCTVTITPTTNTPIQSVTSKFG